MTGRMTQQREPGAGELNRLVTIRQRTDYPTDEMGLGSTFENEIKRWAKIEPVGTAVYLDGIQTDHAITHRITLYRLAGLTREYEIVHASKVFAVRRLTDLNGRGIYTVLDVEELGNG